MSLTHRSTAAISFAVITLTAAAAAAQVPPTEVPPGDPNAAPPADDGAQPPAEDPKQKKEPKAGDFDAGGKVRMPNGPDEMGTYASFNWVAVDATAKYYLLPSVTLTGNAPIALIKPDTAMVDGAEVEPNTFGGMSITLDARLPKMNVPMMSDKMKDTDVGLTLTGVWMREGAILLSDKDFPLFLGSFQPGFASGLTMKVKMSSVVDFKLLPQFVYQTGEVEAQQGVQIPLSLVVGVGEMLKVSADAGVFTGDDFSFGADNGGRISLGAAVDIKIGPIATHLGTGFASLLPGGFYPTVKESVYFDLNVKYVK